MYAGFMARARAWVPVEGICGCVHTMWLLQILGPAADVAAPMHGAHKATASFVSVHAGAISLSISLPPSKIGNITVSHGHEDQLDCRS
jgi:hypothetical protein